LDVVSQLKKFPFATNPVASVFTVSAAPAPVVLTQTYTGVPAEYVQLAGVEAPLVNLLLVKSKL
jgi:hypothetical protein